MLSSILCDWSDAYILLKRTVTVAQVLATAVPDNDGKEVVFKNWVLFTDYLREINNKQIDTHKKHWCTNDSL